MTPEQVAIGFFLLWLREATASARCLDVMRQQTAALREVTEEMLELHKLIKSQRGLIDTQREFIAALQKRLEARP